MRRSYCRTSAKCIRCRAHIKHLLAHRVYQIGWNSPAVPSSVIAVGRYGNPKILTGVIGIVRIPDRAGEHSTQPDRLGNRGCSHEGGRIAQALVISENERPILDDGTSCGCPELVTLPEGFVQPILVREEIACVQYAVAKKIVHRPMQFVRT